MVSQVNDGGSWTIAAWMKVLAFFMLLYHLRQRVSLETESGRVVPGRMNTSGRATNERPANDQSLMVAGVLSVRNIQYDILVVNASPLTSPSTVQPSCRQVLDS
jgi:hypothetical protein